MATHTIGQPEPPERMTDYMRCRLASEYAALDTERLKLQEAAAQKGKRQKEIEAQLGAQLHLDGVPVYDLPRWQFGFELVDGTFSYKDELVKAIGEAELATRKALVPQREKFFLRDKGRPLRRTSGRAAPRKRKAA